MTNEVKQFINNLQPKDIGEEQIGEYIVAYEGFTDSCFDYLIENGLTIEETEKFLLEEWNKQFGIPIETDWKNKTVTYTEPNILYSIYKVNKQSNLQINKRYIKFLIASITEPVALMKLTLIDDPSQITDEIPIENLVVEKKYDGWSCQVIITDTPRLYSRRGKEVTDNFPDIVNNINFPKDSFLIGELIWWTKEGKQDISKIQSIAGSSIEKALEKTKEYNGYPSLVIYGALEIDGKKIVDTTYEETKNKLEKIFEGRENKYFTLINSYPFDEWEKIMDDAIAEGGEGVVFKNLTEGYKYANLGSNEPKPKNYWFKYKGGKGKHQTDDFVIYDFERTEAGSLLLKFGQYADNELFHIGQIDSFSREEEDEIIELTKSLPFVIEIGFQERTKEGKLRHQRFIRIRGDKASKDCILPNKEWSEHMKKVNIKQANKPTHPDTIIIEPNEYYKNGLNEIQIYEYLNTVKPKLINQFKNNPVMIVSKIDGTILRRNESITKEPLQLTEETFEKLNNGRNMEFHIVLPEKETDLLWVDLDPKEEYPWNKTKEIAIQVEQVIKNNFDTKSTQINFSGRIGLHIVAYLKEKINVDDARNQLKELLRANIEPNFTNTTVDITKDKNTLRLDVSTLKLKGSIKAEYSLSAKTGLVVLDIRKINKDIMKVEKLDFTIDKVLRNKQATKTVTKYKVIFFNMKEHDESSIIYESEQEAIEAGESWLKENDYNEYTIYPIEEQVIKLSYEIDNPEWEERIHVDKEQLYKADLHPIEIIEDIDITHNSLKSLDKISYKMSDILNYKLKNELIKLALKFDPNSTVGEGRWRIRNPKDFKQDTFRRWNSWAGVKAPEGVQFLVGNLKETGKKALQTIRFQKDTWDEKKASIYWSKIKDKSGFNKIWTQADWDKEKTAMKVKEELCQDATAYNVLQKLRIRANKSLTTDKIKSIKGKYSHVSTSSDKFAQSKSADTTLFNNPWITVRQDNKGYTYASVPEGVAILPYRYNDAKDIQEYLLRSEQNSVLAPEGSLITVITGRRGDEDKGENWYIQTAIRELEEEAGIVATEDRITLLGEMSTNKHTKQSDILLAVDVTGLEENEPEIDGTDNEVQSYNFWVDEKRLRDFIRTSKDSYLSTITNKFFNKDVNLSIVNMGRI